MWKLLKFLFIGKSPTRVKFSLDKSFKEEEYLKNEEELAKLIDEVSESNADPILIEKMLKEIEAEFLKAGKKIELFHKDVVLLKNDRCDDEDLETREGTRRSLLELQSFATQIEDNYKRVMVNDPEYAENSDLVYYWSI